MDEGRTNVVVECEGDVVVVVVERKGLAIREAFIVGGSRVSRSL